MRRCPETSSTRRRKNGKTVFTVSDGWHRVRAAAVEASCCDLVFRNWCTNGGRQSDRGVVCADTDQCGALVNRRRENLCNHSCGSHLLNYFASVRKRALPLVSCIADYSAGRFVSF